jgi:hypothetical protein
MQDKDLIGLVLAVLGAGGGILCACISQRVRDWFFIAMVFLAPMTEKFDINFVSRDFYRGTTRGFEFSIVDILSISLVVAALLVPRLGQARVFWPGSFGFMLLLFAYACLNVAVSDPQLFGLFELSKMLRGISIFLAVAFYLKSERELKLLLFALAAIVCYEGFLALKQRYYYGIHRVYGTIDDSNSLSVFFCTTAPILAASITARLPRLYKLLAGVGIALASVGVILTISRTGVMTLGIVLLGTAAATVSPRLTARKVVIALVVLVTGAGLVGKSWKTLSARFQESSLEKEYGNKRAMGRGYYLRMARAIAEDRWLGVGLNNWSWWVSNKYGPRQGYRFVPYRSQDKDPSTIVPANSNVDMAQAAPAHSLGALTLGELGIPGLILFALLWIRWFIMGAGFLLRRTPEPMRRIGVGLFFAVLGIFLHSLTEWVFRQSPIYYVIHIVLGAMAALAFAKRHEKKHVSANAENEPLASPCLAEVASS